MSTGIALPFHDLGASMGVGGQHHAPAALRPRKTAYPLYGRPGRPQGRSGRVRKISPPTGIRSPDRPARSESLYRLSYPDPSLYRRLNIIHKFANNKFLYVKVKIKAITVCEISYEFVVSCFLVAMRWSNDARKQRPNPRSR